MVLAPVVQDAARLARPIVNRAHWASSLDTVNCMPKAYQSGDITPIRNLPKKSRSTLKVMAKLLDATQGEVVEAALDYLLVHLAKRDALFVDLQTAVLIAEQKSELRHQILLAELDTEVEDGGIHRPDPAKLDLYRQASKRRCITPLPDEAEFQQRQLERRQRRNQILGLPDDI